MKVPSGPIVGHGQSPEAEVASEGTVLRLMPRISTAHRASALPSKQNCRSTSTGLAIIRAFIHFVAILNCSPTDFTIQSGFCVENRGGRGNNRFREPLAKKVMVVSGSLTAEMPVTGGVFGSASSRRGEIRLIRAHDRPSCQRQPLQRTMLRSRTS